jgi:hypothetical protein
MGDFVNDFKFECVGYASFDASSIESQIEAAEYAVKYHRGTVADAEKQLADLKAKKARLYAEKAKTVGERIAEGFIKHSHGATYHIGFAGMTFGGTLPQPHVALRRDLARLIDDAVAEARKDEREKAARFCGERAAYNRQKFVESNKPTFDHYADAQSYLATELRLQK